MALSNVERQKKYREADRQRSRDSVQRSRHKKLAFLHAYQSAQGCGV